MCCLIDSSLLARTAAHLRLYPAHLRRPVVAPAQRPRPHTHTVEGDGDVLRQRQRRQLPHEAAIQPPQLHDRREAPRGHAVAVGPLDPRHHQVAAVRRGVHLCVQARRRDLLGGAGGHVDADEGACAVVVEQGGIVFVLEQVGEGPVLGARTRAVVLRDAGVQWGRRASCYAVVE